jgi:hypothetical protein
VRETLGFKFFYFTLTFFAYHPPKNQWRVTHLTASSRSGGPGKAAMTTGTGFQGRAPRENNRGCEKNESFGDKRPLDGLINGQIHGPEIAIELADENFPARGQFS